MGVEQVDNPSLLLPWYQEASRCFALIRAVLEGRQPGTAHLIEAGKQKAVFVANNFGFAQFFGEVESDAIISALFDALQRLPALSNRYLLWYDPPPLCRRHMDSLPEGVARARTRIAFDFKVERFAARAPDTQVTGVEIVPLDNQVLDEIAAFGLDIENRFWPSRKAFLEQGYGSAARLDNQIASLCYSACVAGGVAEVDVVTREEFRGKGLARIVTAAFISDCLANGITPNWDCFDYNQASLQLALSLGFTELSRYPFYSVNT